MNKFHPNWKSLSDCTKCGEFMGHGHECLDKPKFTQGMDVQTSPFPQNAEIAALRSELAAAQKEVERLTKKLERKFRLMDGPSVPWSVIAPHEHQAQKNHSQTLERLAERGGLSCAEFWFVMNDLSWERGKFKEAGILGKQLAEKLNSDYERAEHSEQREQTMRELLQRPLGILHWIEAKWSDIDRSGIYDRYPARANAKEIREALHTEEPQHE